MESGTLWSCDVDGNGIDELAYVQDGRLRVVSPDNLGHSLWKEETSSTRYACILDVRSATSESLGEIVALRATGDNSVVGLDAATGQVRCIAAAPLPRDRKNYVAPQISTKLGLDPKSEMPLVPFQFNQMTHCRTTMGKVCLANATRV